MWPSSGSQDRTTVTKGKRVGRGESSRCSLDAVAWMGGSSPASRLHGKQRLPAAGMGLQGCPPLGAVGSVGGYSRGRIHIPAQPSPALCAQLCKCRGAALGRGVLGFNDSGQQRRSGLGLPAGYWELPAGRQRTAGTGEVTAATDWRGTVMAATG